MRWKKDNGQEIETNDLEATVKHCESIGWTRADPKQISDEPPKKKGGRPKKKED